MPRHASIGRRLYSKARLWQDWDGENEAENVSPGYWELFVDLLLVAAASALADTFLEDQSPTGWLKFAFLYSAIINSWLLYTHHYTSRFQEASLLHTLVLFVYLLGMAGSIVNASYETASLFSMSIILQRVGFLCMLIPIGHQLPRAKDFVFALGIHAFVGIIPFFVAIFQPEYAVFCFGAAAIVDSSTEIVMATVLRKEQLIPINIEHTKDRLGVLILIMLGETVISSTMSYREYAAERDAAESRSYYIVLTLSFLLIFMFTLLFFNLQPHPKDHAFRRSRFAGVSVMILNKWIGMGLLMVGVSIKLVVHSVAEDEPMSEFSNKLLTRAVGFSMILLLLSRLAHFGGKVPGPQDPPRIRALMYFWWGLIFVASIVPFALPDLSHPIKSLFCVSGWLFAICVIESGFSHVLEAHLPSGHGHGDSHAREESQLLTQVNESQG